MTTRMLIDARHPEETRVVVMKGDRLEEFDFEAAARKQIRGNIYLAKVSRVEPSLQAAFVDYGGNRHGFLPFSEIHPDYYQIPREDREALLREESRLARESLSADGADGAEAATAEPALPSDGEGREEPNGNGSRVEDHGNTEDASVEALRRQRMALRRKYKIQEVIKRRQVLLVQVVKEERGNKGAALTTYLSLAGRYSVLMPNTAHGGGISRKIASAADRKRLRAIMAELDLPPTMGAIVRTAGLERTKAEIRRDFDYLTRLWDEIRETTLASTAPALIYEDSDLVKRAIRDIYSREVEEVLVDGEAAYRQARSYMKLLMPSHVKRVKLYADPVPLFLRAGVEGQLAAMMNPAVQLKSGGYIVFNPTEALVAVDVNSGRSTREYNIEETALKTNIEAAEEVARQLRLRDLAGLIVVDFIDMESSANNKKVERALKEALKADRARIQVGRISPFGLLEMSRQRLRTGVFEASTVACPTCGGAGVIRTPASASLAALRLLEEEIVRGKASQFRLRADPEVAVYMLNRKKADVLELETRYGVTVEVVPDETLSGARFAIDASGAPPARLPAAAPLALPGAEAGDGQEDEARETEAGPEADAPAAAQPSDALASARAEEEKPRKRRRRRGGRNRRRDRGADAVAAAAPAAAGPPDEAAVPSTSGAEAKPEADLPDAAVAPAVPDEARPEAAAEGLPAPPVDAAPAAARPARRRRQVPEAHAAPAPGVPEEAPGPTAVPDEAGAGKAGGLGRTPRRRRVGSASDRTAAQAPADASETGPAGPSPAPPSAAAEARLAPAAADGASAPAVPAGEPAAPASDPGGAVPVPAEAATRPAAASTAPPRRGWWQRTFGG